MNNDSNDLIKRGAVCDMLHKEMDAWGNCADEIEALLKANDALWEIPAVDAVEVVRCKDCEHFVEPSPYDPCECMKWTIKWGRAFVQPNDFCSYGERREDG